MLTCTLCHASSKRDGQVIVLDGKQLRRWHDKKLGKDAIYMVSAWATANHLVLGQTKGDEKSNEITALLKLLQALELSGCIVTVDAIGSQKAERALEAVRTYWGIENGLHWVLDVAFRENDCRIRKGYGAQNFAVLRHIALNLLKQEQTARCGIKNKRLRAGWDEAYLFKVLNATN